MCNFTIFLNTGLFFGLIDKDEETSQKTQITLNVVSTDQHLLLKRSFQYRIQHIGGWWIWDRQMKNRIHALRT